jgi:hypothetical protein
MKSVAAYLVTIIVLLAVGGVLWNASKREAQLAAAEYRLVTLRYDTAAEELTALTTPSVIDPILRRISPPADAERAAASYWGGDLQALSASDDPAMRLLATNAEYRALRQTGGPWQAVVARLDAIGKRYADILRNEPTNEDAAYNYEFIVRLRGSVVAAKQPMPAGDYAYAGVTPHGVAGAPPDDSDAKKFKMIVPMLPDERQEAEEAGRTARKVRKG